MDEDTDVQKMRKYILDIKLQRQKLDRESSELEKEYKERRKVIGDKKRSLQKRCPHVDITHHPDASGNNDSSESCNTCGAEAKRLGVTELYGH